MLIIILLLVFGLAIGYVSQYNSTLVSVNLGSYIISDVSIFYVIMASFIFGLILSYIVYFINDIFVSFSFRRKNNEIWKNKNEVLELSQQIHQHLLIASLGNRNATHVAIWRKTRCLRIE